MVVVLNVLCFCLIVGWFGFFSVIVLMILGFVMLVMFISDIVFLIVLRI